MHGKPSVPCNVCQAARSNGRVAAVGYSSEYGEAPSPFLLFISSVLIQCVYLFYRQYEQREGGTWTNKDVNVGYVPSGMSVHEWHEFKRAENKQTKNKNFAAIGPTSFKSRSLQGQYQWKYALLILVMNSNLTISVSLFNSAWRLSRGSRERKGKSFVPCHVCQRTNQARSIEARGCPGKRWTIVQRNVFACVTLTDAALGSWCVINSTCNAWEAGTIAMSRVRRKRSGLRQISEWSRRNHPGYECAILALPEVKSNAIDYWLLSRSTW